MVRHSLRSLIEKYPYFFDKRPISNFFKITKVYNKNFQLIYNDLFKTYESFHLNKRILIWKEQSIPYEYNIHFVSNFPSLKSVKIYKNNYLIYKRTYKEEENIDSFEYIYHAKYTKSNVLSLYAYQCSNPECNTIYFDYNLPNKCTTTLSDGSVCNNSKYVPVKVYGCSECGEVYFSQDEITNCTKNNHTNSLQEWNIYKCRNCGQIYFGIEPPEECDCYEDETQTTHTQMKEESSSTIHTRDTYYLEDNSEDYTEYGDNVFKVLVYDENDSPLSNVAVNLTCNNNVYESYTNGNGIALLQNLIEGEYNVDVTLNGYGDGNLNVTIPNDYEKTVVLKKYENEMDIGENPFDMILPAIPEDKFLMVVETYDEYELVKGFPENDYTLTDYNRALKENKIVPNAYDHDYSLDLIGALNNIPRKTYKLVEDSEYPYTEPPYNNKQTEDDYHYMLRMIEYNLRLWYMSPPSLELWKIYGIESELVNRERYLLKVFDEQKHPFDESTGLVKCWTPEKWEHKDRFCDGSTDFGEYFFVNSSTVRPIRGQDVDFTFKVLNSLAEPIEEEFYVDVYKIENEGINSVNTIKLFENQISTDKFRLSYRSINIDKPTVLLFKAYHLNGELLGSTKVVLNVRTHADWYVKSDANIKDGVVDKNYSGDGSKENPFLTLQEALDKVNNSLNLICLQSNIEIKEPLIVNQNTIIIGEDNLKDPNNPDSRYVPRIFQKGVHRINKTTLRYRRDFFKLVGSKNCELILSNLRLVSGQINSYIGLDTWKNTSPSLDIFESVIIHGGALNLSVTINQEKYYPFDFVDCIISLKKKNNEALSDTTIEIHYKNKLVAVLTTDENGECNYKFNLKETKVGSYTLHILNKTELFFESDIGQSINARKQPHYYYPHNCEDVELEISHYEIDDSFKLYSDKEGMIDEVNISEENELLTISEEDEISYKIKNVPFGKYVYYSTIDDSIDSSVEEEWIIESLFPIKNLITDEENKPKFIKNVVFNNSTGDIIYEEFQLPSNPKMKDLDGVVLDIKSINGGNNIEVNTFNVPLESEESEELLYSEAETLMNALTEINLNVDNGILTGERLGKFW